MCSQGSDSILYVCWQTAFKAPTALPPHPTSEQENPVPFLRAPAATSNHTKHSPSLGNLTLAAASNHHNVCFLMPFSDVFESAFLSPESLIVWALNLYTLMCNTFRTKSEVRASTPPPWINHNTLFTMHRDKIVLKTWPGMISRNIFKGRKQFAKQHGVWFYLYKNKHIHIYR